eukprot:TRINITY_DN26458_c0_g2_i1.p1 TRINITY_DN26458_c0_g2~~TRINITY_DN26458_c0_g2_i1.p1  ORF type:complete len:235 (+),score=20.52 TRINITY_DN26458_c0_g2_i1:83-706(+)
MKALSRLLDVVHQGKHSNLQESLSRSPHSGCSSPGSDSSVHMEIRSLSDESSSNVDAHDDDVASREMAEDMVSMKKNMAQFLGLPSEHLDALTCNDVYDMIPRDREGEITSVGSVLHGSGSCVPCLFFYRNSCKRELGCSCCHIAHAGGVSTLLRRSKQRRPKDSRCPDGSSCDGLSSSGSLLTWERSASSPDGDGQTAARIGCLSL